MEDWNGGWVKMIKSNFILFFFLKSLTFVSPSPQSLCHNWIIPFTTTLSPQLKSLKYHNQFFYKNIYFCPKKGLHMWLWLIQRDLECIYTFANVPATLLYYSNFYCKNRLSAIWWSLDFWGIACHYCYNWYPLQAWEKIWLRLLEGFLL